MTKSIIDRRDTHSIKWDSSEADVLPMWIADMDFKTAPAVTEALRNRVAHGVFGYTLTPPEFYEAIIEWWEKDMDSPFAKTGLSRLEQACACR